VPAALGGISTGMNWSNIRTCSGFLSSATCRHLQADHPGARLVRLSVLAHQPVHCDYHCQNGQSKKDTLMINRKNIPYGRQVIDEQDIEAVAAVLRSDWLTTGPSVHNFESTLSCYVGVKYGVAVSSGTAALHCAMYAIGISPGDEVIVPAMTFAATANAVVFQGGTPVFADVDPETLLIDPVQAEGLVSQKTKAIIAVDYAGQPCDYVKLRSIADKHGLALIADACHALGAECLGRRVGSLADITLFSFHPVKHITTGEGGMAVTDSDNFSSKMRLFRNHGISTDFREREKIGSWHYEMVDLGYNYRMSDIQCALGISQLQRLPFFLQRRREIATMYHKKIAENYNVKPLGVHFGRQHAWHLFVIRLSNTVSRSHVFQEMRSSGIGVNVHYIPVHLHPYYQKHCGTSKGMCPNAEEAYQHILSLPIWPGMSDADVESVIQILFRLT